MEKDMINIALLASGNGTNMQTIIDACKTSRLKARPCVVISNNIRSGSITKARRARVPHYYIDPKPYPPPVCSVDDAILNTLRDYNADLVVLAGYTRKIGQSVIDKYPGRIINIHPSLLPKYGGQGMYGARVHKAVLAAGEVETGVTIHLVDEGYDTGTIIAQVVVPVIPGDTVEMLGQRVLKKEHELLVRTLKRIIAGQGTEK